MSLPPCPHRPPCPGCPRYGESGLAAAPLGILRHIARETGAVLESAVEGAQVAFRARARLAVRGRASSPKLGIFQEGSHRIVDIPFCAIHHDRINEASAAIKRAIRSADVAPYADAPHRGVLRYVQLVVERETLRVQITLVSNDDTPASLGSLPDALQSYLGEHVQALWWNGNTERTNVIFGERWQKLAGEDAVREHVGGAEVFFPPGAFGQSNLALADRIVGDVHALVPDAGVVTELHAGCGSFGLGLLGRCASVRFNERSPHGLLGLRLGLDALPAELRSRASVHEGEAAKQDRILEGAGVVISDPPRKGLEPELVASIVAARPALFAYVSCDPGSLARDVTVLTAGGAMRLERMTPYALFPYTDHVETLAVLVPGA